MVVAPGPEGRYPISVDINKGDDGETDISDIATGYVQVQNMVTITPGMTPEHTIGESKEDRASKQVVVKFTTNHRSGGLTMDDNDTISIMLTDFVLPASIAASNITIAGATVATASPSSVTINGDVVTLTVPDMRPTQLLTQGISNALADDATAGVPVTVTFKEEAGKMNPMNGGPFSVKVHPSKSTKPAEQMDRASNECVAADGTATAPDADGTCTNQTGTTLTEPKAVKLVITPTTPDVARVSIENDVSAGYTGTMTVRFVTDADLSPAVAAANGNPAVPADTITLKLGEVMNGVYSGFVLPEADFFPRKSVLVNGHEVGAPDVDSDNGTVKVAMPTNAIATDSVSVTFLGDTGIMNPMLPVTDPPTPMMDYAVMVKTSVEDDEYGSEMVTIMQAEEAPMVPRPAWKSWPSPKLPGRPPS